VKQAQRVHNLNVAFKILTSESTGSTPSTIGCNQKLCQRVCKEDSETLSQSLSKTPTFAKRAALVVVKLAQSILESLVLFGNLMRLEAKTQKK